MIPKNSSPKTSAKLNDALNKTVNTFEGKQSLYFLINKVGVKKTQ